MIFCPECHDTVTIIDTTMRPGIVESCYCGRLSHWTEMDGPHWRLASSPGILGGAYVFLARDSLYKSAPGGHTMHVHDSVLTEAVRVRAGDEEEEIRHVVRLMVASEVLES